MKGSDMTLAKKPVYLLLAVGVALAAFLFAPTVAQAAPSTSQIEKSYDNKYDHDKYDHVKYDYKKHDYKKHDDKKHDDDKKYDYKKYDHKKHDNGKYDHNKSYDKHDKHDSK